MKSLIDVVPVFLLFTLSIYFTHFCRISIVDSEQVNVNWVVLDEIKIKHVTCDDSNTQISITRVICSFFFLATKRADFKFTTSSFN